MFRFCYISSEYHMFGVDPAMGIEDVRTSLFVKPLGRGHNEFLIYDGSN